MMENMNQDMIDLKYQRVDEVLVVVNKDHEEQLEVMNLEKQVTKLLELMEA
jgi:hypothetical protein